MHLNMQLEQFYSSVLIDYLMWVYYTRRTLNYTQLNYSTTEKELLAVEFALDRLRSYLLESKVIIFYHAALKYLLSKKDAKARLIVGSYCYKSLI